MPSTKDIRRRIKSIRSTRQITRAMELVSAAKMRRAQAQALATRTYSVLVWELAQNLASRTSPELHRLLRRPEQTKKICAVILTSNRGLIGGFNNNIINAALKLDPGASEIEYITLGKKGRDAMRKRGRTIMAEFKKKDTAGGVLDIAGLSRLLTEDFVSGKSDRAVLVYMDFVSTLVQKPVVRELLPLVHPHLTSPLKGEEQERESLSSFPSPRGGGQGRGENTAVEYLFEPTPDQVLETLLPRLVEMQLYQALLETNASEHSARMVAMKNASDAASDLVDDLTLDYNQLRQAGITKEISEIVAGRLALQ